jgi:transposase
VLAPEHLCFFIHEVVERLDVREFDTRSSDEGQRPYPPQMMLKVWFYAYALGLTSSRRLQQRIVEDLAFRYLAGGLQPDHWTLNDFRRNHARGLTRAFTQVLEFARDNKLARVGQVAVDSTRVQANASRDRVNRVSRLRSERARLMRQVRTWQRSCNCDDSQAGAGSTLTREQYAAAQKRLAEIPRQLQELKRAPRLQQVSRTDPESRFLRARGGFVLGYTLEMAVTEDHFIVAQRVTQNATDHQSLVPVIDAIEKNCKQRPRKVIADTGFYSHDNLRTLQQRRIQAYIPETMLAWELKHRRPVHLPPSRDPVAEQARRRLRRRRGQQIYRQRKCIIEPVFGTLKAQRSLYRFRRRGLEAVSTESMWASIAYNITHLFQITRRRS